jgi:PAS domain S-box-containing protein
MRSRWRRDVADRIWATLEHRRAEVELRANEERLQFLLRLNDALRPLSDAGEVQETASRLLGQHLGATRVGYAEFAGGDYQILREYVQGVPPLAGHSPGILLSDEMRAALRRGEAAIVNDVQTDPRLSDEQRATLQSRQIEAFIGTVLFKGGRMVAAFGANHARPRVWTSSEVALVQDVAERTWDAVERTRAEAALREQKQRLGIALEASAGGSWTWIAATNQADWDERFRALYGFAPDEPATADAWVPRIHEHDRARVIALLEEVMTSTTKNSWESTFRIVRPDGTIAWIQSRGRADRDADGKLTRLSGLDLDFSHHRRSEEAQQARRDEEHDRALRTLLETAAQGIVSVDTPGMIATANHAFEAMFGWPPGALIGQPIERLMPSVFRRTSTARRPAPGRHPSGRFYVSDRSQCESRLDGRRRARIRIRDRHHRSPARRVGARGAHRRTRVPHDAIEPDGVGPDAGRAARARANRQNAPRRACNSCWSLPR